MNANPVQKNNLEKNELQHLQCALLGLEQTPYELFRGLTAHLEQLPNVEAREQWHFITANMNKLMQLLSSWLCEYTHNRLHQIRDDFQAQCKKLWPFADGVAYCAETAGNMYKRLVRAFLNEIECAMWCDSLFLENTEIEVNLMDSVEQLEE